MNKITAGWLMLVISLLFICTAAPLFMAIIGAIIGAIMIRRGRRETRVTRK